MCSPVEQVGRHPIREQAGQHRAAKVHGHPATLAQPHTHQPGQAQEAGAQQRPEQLAVLLACPLGSQCRAVATRACHRPRACRQQGGLFVNGQHLGRQGFGAVVGFVAGARSIAQALAQRRVVQQALQGVGHLLRLVVHQQCLLFVAKQFFNARQAAGHDGQASAHGFQDGHGQAFVVRQQHEHAVLGQLRRHIGHVTGKTHLRPGQLAGLLFQRGALRSIAQKSHIGAASARHQGQRLQQQVVALGGRHARDHHHAGSPFVAGAFGHIGNRIGHHAGALRVHGQARGQGALVFGDAHHAGCPGCQHRFGRKGIAPHQPRRLRLETKAMHGVDHRCASKLARQTCHHTGHGAVRVQHVGRVGAHVPSQGLHRGQQPQRVERIAQGRHGQGGHAQILQGLLQKAAGLAADHRRKPHLSAQAAAQLDHMGLRAADLTLGDDEQDVQCSDGHGRCQT